MSTSDMLKIEIAGLHFNAPCFVAAGPPSRDAPTLISMAEGGAGGLVAKTISTVGAKVARPCMAQPSAALKGSMLNIELWTDHEPEYFYGDGGVYDTVKAAPACKGMPLIASLGYNKEEVSKLVPLMDKHVDAYEFSCHYTDVNAIVDLAKAIIERTKKPVFAKLSPHGYDLLDLATKLRAVGVSGFVVMNSLGPCLMLDVEKEGPVLGGAGGKGWLSGQAVRPIALYWVAQLAQHMPDVPIIGVGGVESWHDVVEFFLAGASAVQVCTAAIYEGPKVFDKINKGLVEYLTRKGYKNISELRGKALAKLPTEANLVPGVSFCDESKCIHCGMCEKNCTYHAITVDKKHKKWTVKQDACYGCGLCTTICPKGALTLKARK